MKSLSEFMDQEPPTSFGGGIRRNNNNRYRKRSSVKYTNPYLVHSEYAVDDAYLTESDDEEDDDDQSMGNQSESDLNYLHNGCMSGEVGIHHLNANQTKLLGEIQRQRQSSTYLQRRSTLQKDNILNEIREGGRSSASSSRRTSRRYQRTSVAQRRSSSVQRKAEFQNALQDLLGCCDDENNSNEAKLLQDISDRYQQKGKLRMSMNDASCQTVTTAELSTATPGENNDFLMDDTSSRMSVACGFRPDDSVSMLDISEQELEPVNVEQNPQQRRESLDKNNKGNQKEFDLGQFWNDRMDTFTRNIDYLWALHGPK